MTTQRQELGAYGERVAADHLREQGLVILDRNWRCSDGEIDLILRDRDDIVFCEVKTRTGEMFGSPAESIGPRKVRRLRRLAARWLDEAGVHADEIRFDVVEVRRRVNGTDEIAHIRAAF
jgi:putative endonuclease